MMPSPKRIAVILPSLGERDGEIFRGLRAYVSSTGPWWLHVVSDRLADVRDLKGWAPDGVVAVLRDHEVADEVCAWQKPSVNVSNAFPPSEFPLARVACDDVAVGEMAARYFLARRFRHFAMFDQPGYWWSDCRREGFESVLTAAGFPCSVSGELFGEERDVRNGRGPSREERIVRWASGLGRTTAVFAVNDYRARELLEVFLAAGIRVPTDVAVVGVENEPIVCEVARPPLSSIATDPRRVGYEAAVVLDQLLAGGNPRVEKYLPPTGVVTRQSSDLLATSDPEVLEALRYIQGHCHRPIRTEHVAEQVPLSRRQLERRFALAVGHGIQHAIHLARIDRARSLLLETDLPMPAVAARSGFNNPQRFNAIFRRESGMTPTLFRRQFRLGVELNR